MRKSNTLMAVLAGFALVGAADAQPLVNLGLVGVGRLPGDSFDQLGTGVDTLGGIFSGMWLDPASVVHSNGTIHTTVYALPDRGFGDGLQDYHPRIQRLAIAITPYFGPGPAPQDQIVIVNTGTYLLTVNGSTFTGYQPDDTNVVSHPQSLPGGLGGGKRSLDPEGIAYAAGSAGGSWYISDEYGPFVYHFDAAGALLGALPLPDAFIPRVGTNYPRAVNYLTGGLNSGADSGRHNNRGMEGLGVTPDGKKLVACLQSPLAQDGESRNPSRHVRILVYDIDPASPTYHQPVAEYVHVLPLSAAEANNRHTPVSEILPLSDTRFLILQRDSRGLGGDPGNFLYKRVVEVDASNASNILGTGYDLEKQAPGQLSLPRSGLPSNIVAVASRDLVDLLNASQLAKYGLNLAPSNQTLNTLSEKWEALAVLPLNDPAAPDDYLLLVGNDNDFRAPVVYHNGVPVGTNAFGADNMLLAFRIGADTMPPSIVCPAPVTVMAGTNCTATVDLRARAVTSDNSAAPVIVLQTPSPTTPLALGTHEITLVAVDAAGNQSAPCTTTATAIDQTPPIVTRVTPSLTHLWPANNKMVPVTLTVEATDNCSSALRYEIISVASNEEAAGCGSLSGRSSSGRANGAAAGVQITGPLSLNLRAQRSARGSGRFYIITVRCTDEAGNSSLGVTSVFVPRSAADLASGLRTSIAPYALPVGQDYSLLPLLSVGDRVPRTTDPNQVFQMIGIPDGLGAHANQDGTTTVFMNHELPPFVVSEPIVGQPLSRGAFVSTIILAPDGSVLSGDLAYDAVYAENVYVGPPATVSNTTPAFARFCSGALGWKEAGFDRPIYFCGEEAGGTNTFDGRGGVAVAIFDNAAWTLPRLGHMAWENAVPRPHRGGLTAIMCLEDGEVGQCQLYLYVGWKDRSSGAGPLRRNGLDNGSLYVFVADSSIHTNEATFPNGELTGRWVLLSGAENMNELELEAASDAVGAFAFDRVEDGAFRPRNPNEFYFVTTGGSASNALGRLYQLALDPNYIVGPAKLTMMYNADQVVADGGDVALSPDNVAVGDDYLMICEDGTAQSRPVMAAKGRKGNIWRINLRTGELDNVAEMTAVARDGRITNPGVWETSGIIEMSTVFGPDSWLFDVQAHSPTRPPLPNTVEDGQLLLMLRNR
ncbi:MAG TPA: esterase-like activity of phytase family protein [Methylomirabilota bacterium]|nr:esterase-like activity of phytase family protein [Methylomirabilota bacterium]